MLSHDPYKAMLDELRLLNGLDDEEQLKETLRLSQRYVRELRKAYSSSPAEVDYSCAHQRAAYLLAYYPHYIEPIYHSLCDHIPTEFTQAILNESKLRSCFLGAGPAPEILGLLLYLNEHSTSMTHCLCHILDKHEWLFGQITTAYHISASYWNGILRTFPTKFDILSDPKDWDGITRKHIAQSRLIVMQNCLNDLVKESTKFLESFAEVIRIASPGTLFIIIDLHYPKVAQLIKEVEKLAQNMNCNPIVVAQNEPTTFYSEIRMPQIIIDELLTGEDGLMPRKKTKFYLSAFQR